MGQGEAADSVPDSDALRVALGAELARQRRARNVGQRSLALRIRYSRGHIAAVETGHGVAAREFWTACDRVLDTGGSLTAQYDRMAVVRRAEQQAWRRPPTTTARPGPSSGPDVLRAHVTDAEERDRVARATENPARVDRRLLGHLDSLLVTQRELEDLLGPTSTLGPAREVLAWIGELSRRARPQFTQGLTALAAQYAQFIGWMLVDAGNETGSMVAYDQAIARAVEARDSRFTAYLLACKAERSLMADDYQLAVHLARAAQAHDPAMTPAARAWSVDLEARAAAQLGDLAECEKKIELAEGLLVRSRGDGREYEPPWVYHYTPEALRIHQATCYADLGEAARSVELFEATIADIAPARVRDRAYYLACSLPAYVQADEPEHALAVAHEATGLARRVRSTRVLGKLARTLPELRRIVEPSAFGELHEALVTGMAEIAVADG